LERWLNDIWYGDRSSGWWLVPLAWVYGAVTAIRRLLYRQGWLKSGRAGIPVIVVGNLSVGGSGKTPLVIQLVTALVRRGLRVGVLSRGHGRRADGIQAVAEDSRPEDVGDEPLLIRRMTGAAVMVGRDRLAAAQQLARDGAEILLSDDGLQHYRLQRDLEIAVVDADRKHGNGRLLPAGPLREPTVRLQTVDWRVVVGSDPDAIARTLGELSGPAFGAQRELAAARNLFTPDVTKPLLQFAGQPVHAVAGLGYPGRFFTMLRAVGLQIVEHAFADHHAYSAEDLAFAADEVVLMTEKDAVKCGQFAGRNWWAVPLHLVCDERAFDQLLAQIIARVARSS